VSTKGRNAPGVSARRSSEPGKRGHTRIGAVQRLKRIDWHVGAREGRRERLERPDSNHPAFVSRPYRAKLGYLRRRRAMSTSRSSGLPAIDSELLLKAIP